MTPTITGIIEQQIGQPGGSYQKQYIISFKVGNWGPFSLSFASEGFDPTVANSQITALAAKFSQLAGAQSSAS